MDRDVDDNVLQCRILVVDDSSDIATLIRDHTRDLRIELVINETAEAGLTTFRCSRFDVVLMDYHLPGENGAEATREIRQWERKWKSRPAAVLALTDLRNFQSTGQMLAAGCTGLLGKPLSRNQLLGSIAPHLRRSIPVIDRTELCV